MLGLDVASEVFVAPEALVAVSFHTFILVGVYIEMLAWIARSDLCYDDFDQNSLQLVLCVERLLTNRASKLIVGCWI